ncbi:MAG: class I SAM-dependent methyltransferase [Verrucomicrobia bacterium]|nr:class I SAM-dependent methyltransferase [Verrucomicrobiota bacterium]
MSERFYEPGPRRAEKVRRLFGSIARRYDLLNDLASAGLHRRWKRLLVQWAQVGPGDRALDVCCGTGDLVFALARTGAEVVGLDFSEPMLAIARQRWERLRSRRTFAGARVEFVLGDALELPFADDSFQAVSIGYGLRNLADIRRGLREMLRTAAPGGRVLILDFGKPRRPLWRSLYFSYLRWWIPLLGRIFLGRADAYAYILESLEAYPAQEGLPALLRELPAEDLRAKEWFGGAMTLHRFRKAA